MKGVRGVEGPMGLPGRKGIPVILYLQLTKITFC